MFAWCDILFAYSNKREYIGNFNFRNVINMEVQRVFDATQSNPPSASGVPPLLTGMYTGVVVNGVDFGSGRITAFKEPTSTDITENGRHLWKQIFNVEVFTTGDSGNFSASPVFSGLLSAYNAQLVSLEESFGFELPQNGDYEYTHTAAVRCLNEPSGAGTSGYIIARNVASGLLASNPPFGYIDAVHSGLYSGVGKRFYTETIDQMNGTAAFEEKFVIQNRDLTKHTVSFDNGYVNITENGVLRHSGVSTASGVFQSNPLAIVTRYDNAMAGAWSRCNSLWNTYANALGVDIYSQALYTQAAQLTKAYDETSQELNYSVMYTNNPVMTTSGYAVEREMVYNMTPLGVTEASEQGTLISYNNKDTSLRTSLVTALNGEMSGSLSRLMSIWNIAAFKKIAETKGVTFRGKRATYGVTYSNDPSFINDGTYLTRTVSIQDNGAVRMHSPYLIVGRATPIIHDPGQTNFGNVICTVSATLPRPTNFYAATPVKPSALNQMFVDSINFLLATVATHTPIDMFVTRASYTYGSDMTAELTTEAQYVYARITRT